jgi:hypothetical protein
MRSPLFAKLQQAKMSALGQKQTSEHVRAMFGLPPKADIRCRDRHVRFVPKADIVSLFHFYTVDGFSFWNSYALICTSP